jgi:hypothetical protein
MVTGMVMSQPYPGAPFTRGYSWDVGAKALSMGGAFTAVSDNYSALYYNPAGLGQIEKTSVVGGFSYLMLEDRTTSLGVTAADDASFSKLNALGVVLPVPTYQGSLVLAFGYHRFRGFGGTMTLADVVLPVNYDVVIDTTVYNLPFNVTDGGQELQEGELSQTSLGASVEVAPDVFVGGSLNIWSGVRDYSWNTYILGGVYPVQILGDPVQYDVMIPDTYYNTHYTEHYSGVNITMGLLFKMMRSLQFGCVIKTPVELRGRRDWDLLIYEEVPPGWEEFQWPDSTDSGHIDHKIQSPWIYQLGGAFQIGPLLLTGDADLKDYSQIRYSTDTPEGVNLSIANNEIRQELRSTLNYRVGGQLSFPSLNAHLRAGYGIEMSPQNDAPSSHDRKTLSFGLGLSFADRFILDAGYAKTSWKYGPDDLVDIEEIQIQKILFTLTYQM